MSKKFKVGDHVYVYDVLKLGEGRQYVSVYSGELTQVEASHYTVDLGNHCFLHKVNQDRMYKTKAGMLAALDRELDGLVDNNMYRVEVARVEDSYTNPTKMQKEAIYAAFQQALVAYGRYCDAFRQPDITKLVKERLTESHKAQNALYDAIGNMDEYKFRV